MPSYAGQRRYIFTFACAFLVLVFFLNPFQQLIQHAKEEETSRPLDVIKVPYAAKWTARMHDNFNISGGTTNSSDTLSANTTSADHTSGAQNSLNSVVKSVRECDWTFSSDYLCTVLHTASSTNADSADLSTIHNSITAGAVLRAHLLPTEGAAPVQSGFCSTRTSATTSNEVPTEWRVEAVHSSGIDMEMLKNQDEPILFYDEFLLYQVG